MSTTRHRFPRLLPLHVAFALLLPALAFASQDAATTPAGVEAPGVTVAASTPAVAAALPRRRFSRQLTYPANALSHSGGVNFVPSTRGVDWVKPNGMMSLTVRRPKDYAGGPVRVRFFYEIHSDESGIIRFSITPMDFKDSTYFETYGGVGTTPLETTGVMNALWTSTAIIEGGANGVSWGQGTWWYMDFVRTPASQGGFPGKLRMMAVSLEY